jgi:gas vesicle protein
MDILKELIAIEREADSEWDKLSRYKEGLPQRIKDETKQLTEAFNHETERVMQTIAQTKALETEEAIRLLKNDLQRKSAEMEAAFALHQKEWRSQIITCVLTG